MSRRTTKIRRQLFQLVLARKITMKEAAEILARGMGPRFLARVQRALG